ncbi:class I SAM-dependent methyltransferase [Streptomyces sp. NPDC021212]|uniref:class I SAM-dependent methyltransferase n=1 Tax=Streptomyces sp. NPDC021212 TaxID=3365118 RepID=UPI00379AD8EF
MTVQQYDEIGEAYEGFKTLPLARYSEVPSFLGMLGPLAGRSVLDLACGTGFYSRSIKRLGAADVLGVDISGEMVAAARDIEERDPLGIRYEVLDAAQLPLPEQAFDAATAVYLLNYADDEETLFRMCRGVHRSLADALGRAGFRDVAWVPLEVPDASAAAFAPGFWDDYLANQPLTMLRCTAWKSADDAGSPPPA